MLRFHFKIPLFFFFLVIMVFLGNFSLHSTPAWILLNLRVQGATALSGVLTAVVL